jgi:DNA polymerase-3 subunit beta
MKVEISRSEFLKAWQMAERSSSTRSTVGSLGGVLVTAEGDKVSLSATDLKTSIKCAADGTEVLKGGSAIFPVRVLGELFKKAPTDVFSVEIEGEKGVIVSGRNKTRFSTWPCEDFPKLPQSDSADVLCDVPASDLLRILSEGSIASSPTDDFPKYLGACLVQLKSGLLHVASSDGHRLSLSKCPCESQCQSDVDLLLPVLPIRELQRLLQGLGQDKSGGGAVRIMYDGSMTWFQMGSIEFSIRRVESSFPNYERILNPNTTTTMLLDRLDLLSALDRIDVIVRSHTRLVVMHIALGGELKLTGRAPEFGTAAEMLDATIDGDALKVGFNVGFLQDGLKSMSFESVKMSLNGEAGQMTLRRDGSDDFLYMLMPVRITEQDMTDSEEEEQREEGEATPKSTGETSEGEKIPEF